ncbi:SDR family oxidoreductase [Amycolatopsis sp. CA-230715]|uniref:SDR family oxidoreductase n=1 Tax=Amycolatopsis sp. CA-230715 TaxID=2745196 RepID=UPI001C032A51|nr:SDR family oxidoreductase [Amycolatopsis sp. CA-230715]QWF76762.1 Sorbitol dehydrogenase [Amycolatopsis sp. CA-230715]
MRIEGAVTMVTGANRGLGKAFADELAARGAATVYAAARDPASVTGHTPVELDITDEASVEAAARRCGDVALLINNAGIAGAAPLIGEPSTARARELMETNYFGTLAMCRAFAPVLARNGGGALVNMLSVVSFFSVPAMGAFCTTKAALWSLTNGVRVELRAQGTQVVGVHASFIDTRLATGFAGRKHAPSDIAAQVLDAVEAGEEEVLADERTRQMKAALPREHELIYPEVQRQWEAGA